jgi:hypothetical protein
VSVPPWAAWTAIVLLALATLSTAFYVFKLYLRTFSGEPRQAPETEPHEGGLTMTLPLVVLAVGAVAAGYLWLPAPGLDFFAQSLRAVTRDALPAAEHGGLLPMAVGTTAMLVGVGLAFMLYKGQADDRLPTMLGKAYGLAARNFGVDALYDRLFVRPVGAVSRFARSFDLQTLDALFVGVPSRLAETGAFIITRLQGGALHMHALGVVFGLVLLFGFFGYPRLDVTVRTDRGQTFLEMPATFGYAYRVDFGADGTYETGDEFRTDLGAVSVPPSAAAEGRARLLVYNELVDAEPREVRLDASPRPLGETELGLAYLPRAARGELPIMAWIEDGAVRLRTNLPAEVEAERVLPIGRSHQIGAARLVVAAVVPVRVEVKNAFGHVTRQELEIALRTRARRVERKGERRGRTR